jgi:hypothetical protein
MRSAPDRLDQSQSQVLVLLVAQVGPEAVGSTDVRVLRDG